jgi:hypothetical protein
MRLGRVIVVGLVAATVPAAPATAATLHVEGRDFGIGDAVYAAGPGEQNQVGFAFEPDGQAVVVTDPGATIAAGEFCESIDAHTARCVAPPISLPGAPDWARDIRWLTVTLGDRDDRFTGPDTYGKDVTANGGRGDDVLTGGGTLVDTLDGGGGGHDELYGGAEYDKLSDGDASGAGDDDILDGGSGESDAVSYAQRTAGVAIDLAAGSAGEAGESDSLVGIEQATGGDGDDEISGTDARDFLFGRAGDDAIEALGSDDLVKAGSGDDRIGGGPGDDYLDGESGIDVPSCGEGDDRVLSTTFGELIEPLCELLGAGANYSTTVPAQPKRVGRRAVWFEARCPVDDAYDNYLACAGTFKLREATGRHRRFARGAFSTKLPQVVRVRLTRLGRRLVNRPGGVVADVSFRAVATEPDYRDRSKADWAIQLGAQP